MAATMPRHTISGPSGNGLFTNGTPTRSWTVSTAKPVTYEVRFENGLLDPANPALAEAGNAAGTTGSRRLLVVEEQVQRLYGDRIAAYFAARGLDTETCVLPAHEQLKTMESAFRVVESMDGFGIARRHEPVVAIGGGVLMDIVGLAASLYRRSTPYVRVPTTLIGLVDAGVGAKTGVNYGRHKNRLGTYHPSSVALLDPMFLATLDQRHISNGLAEILKIALVKDRTLFELLAAHSKALLSSRLQPGDDPSDRGVAEDVLCRAVHGMLEELQPNLWEHQLQRLVDYGHSFSPVIEMEALPELLHGEAVCVDMAFTTVLARRRGLVDDDEAQRVLAVMDDLGLPVWHPACTAAAMERALADTVRHRDGQQRLPLPVGIGQACFVNDLTAPEVRGALEELRERDLALRSTL
ncbi:sedoheptulose 7-phosphate cyclase [Streptomyces nojiriensis]|uniref:sedoheptulose 7-phosphate cyclase n=1 Tax=Streptomyces nojiriensis TaxID=66374 RepID=UPI002E16EC24